MLGYTSAEATLADDTDIAENCGFIPDASGNFEGRLWGDASAVTFNVTGGAFYPLNIREARATGATGVAQLLIVRCRPTPS